MGGFAGSLKDFYFLVVLTGNVQTNVQEMFIKEVANEAAIRKRMSGFTRLLKDLYFFMVLAGKVQVLYGWKLS